MRLGVVLHGGLVGLVATTAWAEPRFEASGFVGVGTFSDKIQLGDSWAPEQKPGTSPLVGGRLFVLVAPHIPLDDGLSFQAGVEGELALATAFTGDSIGAGARPSYFAPVFGWRAHGLVRLLGIGGDIRPHLLAGLGGETVASSSPYMRKETDPIVYWGPGVSFPVAEGWRVRIDGRNGVMAARAGITWTFEVQFGLAATFGLPRTPAARHARDHVTITEQPEIDEKDSDGDHLPDHVDACPDERETINGRDDDDGCPEPDADGDGLTGAADRCPTQAEDKDGFEDTDGCPELDNDRDGVPDTRDGCPTAAENVNNFDDADGCPDGLTEAITTLLAEAGTLTFEPKRARVSEAAQQVLAPVLALLAEKRGARLKVIGHPDRKAKSARELARRRADAVKWHLVDQGTIADRIEASVGSVAKTGPAIELVLIVPP